MARTGTDKEYIEDQTRVIKRSDLIKTILTIVLIAMAGFQIFIFLQNKEQDSKEEEFIFSMKQKCREEGNKIYQQDLKEAHDFQILLNPEYTYNENLNTCLYYGYSVSTSGSGSFAQRWVKDIFTNKDILLIVLIDGEPDTAVCRKCVSSVEEFNKRKKELFNE